ncbi:MAG: DUF4249 domain-containing protein [Bacteroidales bacterium]|nr:DUF4249 domain-containing protein [Bacteroidales bacterium]
MQKKLNIILISLISFLVISSCIDPYTPDIKPIDTNKYVVMGSVDKGSLTQTVNISMTSAIDDPHYIPVDGCTVTISDNQGHSFNLYGLGNGNYTGWVNHQLMTTNSKFKVVVITPDENKLESDYDQMPSTADIDSIYYERKQIAGYYYGSVVDGIQIYLTMNGSTTNSRYYLFDVYETWEHRTSYPIIDWYDGTLHHIDPPNTSRMICWNTKKVNDYFVLNTNVNNDNSYVGYPLNFVSAQTEKLKYGYSLLVKQIALSNNAYNFWNQMKLNFDRGASLYEKQPVVIIGNMHNITHPNQEVLGFFSAVSSTEKRIFISNVKNLNITYRTYCAPSPLPFGLKMIMPNEYPAYLLGSAIVPSECVDCLLEGGTNIKPDFWPN